MQKEIPYIIKYGFNVGKYFRDRSKLIPYSNHTTPQQLFLQSSRGFVKLNTETLKKNLLCLVILIVETIYKSDLNSIKLQTYVTFSALQLTSKIPLEL